MCIRDRQRQGWDQPRGWMFHRDGERSFPSNESRRPFLLGCQTSSVFIHRKSHLLYHLKWLNIIVIPCIKRLIWSPLGSSQTIWISAPKAKKSRFKRLAENIKNEIIKRGQQIMFFHNIWKESFVSNCNGAFLTSISSPNWLLWRPE